MGLKPRKTATWKLYTASILILLFFLFGIAELTVRLMGYSAWQRPDVRFVVDPGPGMFVPDSLLGYRGRSGQLRAVLDDQLSFQMSHNAFGYRNCPSSPVADSLAEIWFLGCSFTHGFGVNDQDCYPCRVQQARPDLKIRNLAMSGYGTLQFLMAFQQELKRSPAPDLVIIGHGAFHHQRNTANRNWRKALAGREVAKDIRYPYAEWKSPASYDIRYTDLAYEPWPGMGWSAFIHFLEQRSNARQDQELRSKELTEILIGEIIQTAQKKGTQILLAGVYRHKETQSILEHFSAKGCPTLDISLDPEDKSLQILPNDQHPNALGHKKMADLIIDYLNSGKWKP